MISYQDKQKITDFRETFRRLINPQKNKDTDEIVDALFYNIECIYEEYKTTVPYIDANKEPYKFHILQPVNGQYTLLDFLLNRAISNIDCIFPHNDNAYDHGKVLKINTKRYEKERSKYSEDFIQKQYQKSKLHESGHALHVCDTVKDNCIHSRDASSFYENYVGFYKKLQGFEQTLSYKYPNILHSYDIKNATQKYHSSVTNSHPFRNSNLDEAVTEYYATKYAGLYNDISNFGFSYVSTTPKSIIIAAPNHLNGYSHSSHFMYHLENLVSKPAMFESIFFESEAALQEFSNKYATLIEQIWSTDNGTKEFPNCPDAFSKLKYLFTVACNHDSISSPEHIQRKTIIAHLILESIFSFAYHQEWTKGHTSQDKIKEISKLSYCFSPIIYHTSKNEWINSPTKDWYKKQYDLINNSIKNDEPSTM